MKSSHIIRSYAIMPCMPLNKLKRRRRVAPTLHPRSGWRGWLHSPLLEVIVWANPIIGGAMGMAPQPPPLLGWDLMSRLHFLESYRTPCEGGGGGGYRVEPPLLHFFHLFFFVFVFYIFYFLGMCEMMTWLCNTHGVISLVLHGEDVTWHFYH